MKPNRLIFILVKICVSAGLIFWITREVDLTMVWISLRSANVWLLGLAFAMYFVGYFITAWRWRILLAAQGVVAPIAYLYQSFMVAIFFNNLLPSTIGGDLSRMYDSWRLGHRKGDAVSVVLIDRLLGMSALLLYALVATLWSAHVRQRLPMLLPLMILGCIAIALVLALLFYNNWFSTALGSWCVRIPVLSKAFGAVAAAISAFRSNPIILYQALGLSLLLQLNVIAHFYVLAQSLGIIISFPAMFVVVPISIVVMMVPISINAIGVREVIFVYIFAVFGVPDSLALALAWIAFVFVILQGVLGGIVFMARRTR
ncbi:MAG: flippase-like domain-containing protein [Gammaproteobacteria bacterium]|nr:flippase-like domain-containing protein [Gammaproteobacteria bacterium]